MPLSPSPKTHNERRFLNKLAMSREAIQVHIVIGTSSKTPRVCDPILAYEKITKGPTTKGSQRNKVHKGIIRQLSLGKRTIKH